MQTTVSDMQEQQHRKTNHNWTSTVTRIMLSDLLTATSRTRVGHRILTGSVLRFRRWIQIFSSINQPNANTTKLICTHTHTRKHMQEHFSRSSCRTTGVISVRPDALSDINNENNSPDFISQTRLLLTGVHVHKLLYSFTYFWWKGRYPFVSQNIYIK